MRNKSLILIGAGGHAKSCIDVINLQKKYNIIGLIGLSKELNNKILNYKVIGTEKNLNILAKKSLNAHVAIGQIKTAKIRKKYINKLKKLKFNLPVISSPLAYISKYSKIHMGSIIMHSAKINANVEIGENCIINTACLIEHDTVIKNNCHISTGVILNGNVTVGNETFIGSGSIVKEGVKIGNNCFIGMGTIVKNNIPDNSKIIKKI